MRSCWISRGLAPRKTRSKSWNFSSDESMPCETKRALTTQWLPVRRQPFPYRITEGLPVAREQCDCCSRTETETRMPASATSSSANVTEGRASAIRKVGCLLS